jgi:GNAT superfamily N-acetyltransferase
VSDGVREATGADAEAVALVHRASWLETYAGLIPATAIEERFRNHDARVARWIGILVNEDAYVAERDGRIVGFATAGSGRGEDPPRDRELEGIYLLEEAHGSGLGQRLLDAAIGQTPAYLWVADGNPRAEAFYRRNRFARDGAREEHAVVPGIALTAVRMVR